MTHTCPNCDCRLETDTTARRVMHTCRNGLLTPLVTEKAKIVTVEREDYIGSDMARRDSEGRPVMATVITTDTHEDRVVYAPTLRLTRDETMGVLGR